MKIYFVPYKGTYVGLTNRRKAEETAVTEGKPYFFRIVQNLGRAAQVLYQLMEMPRGFYVDAETAGIFQTVVTRQITPFAFCKDDEREPLKWDDVLQNMTIVR